MNPDSGIRHAMSAPTLPPDYVPRFSLEEVSRRILYLGERCAVFVQAVNRRYPTWNLNFDPLVLINVAHSAMDDIWRYKVYHLKDKSRRSDAVKRSAYFTKWIIRFRPIYCPRPLSAKMFQQSFDKQDSTLLINEAFALDFALTFLATEANVELITLSKGTMASLLYDLHYRNLSDDALMQIYQMIRLRAQGKDIIAS